MGEWKVIIQLNYPEDQWWQRPEACVIIIEALLEHELQATH